MSGIFPDPPRPSAAGLGVTPSREWVMPAVKPVRHYLRLCAALPAGMPSCLKVRVVHTAEGTERSTAAIYGTHAYLIHYEFKPYARKPI